MALFERFRELTISSALAARATSDPERPFLLSGRETASYGNVEADAEALAAGLAELGVEQGDRIALVLPACPEAVVTIFAAAKLGAGIVPLDPRMPPGELQYMLRHSEAVCAVTIERAYGVDYLQVFEDLLVRLPELQYLVTVGEEDLWYDDRIFQFEDLISSGVGRNYPERSVSPGDRFAIVYTAGTTGKPKGVELSHANLLAAAAGTAEAIELKPGDRVAGVSGIFHVFGLGPGVLSGLVAGAALILEDGSDAGAVLDGIERWRATVQYGVPTTFASALLEQKRSPRDLGSLRLALVAGAPVGPELVERIRNDFGADVLVAYSLTEASSTVSVGRLSDPPHKRAETVGRPLPGNSVRILERDGQPLPTESVGEIAVRGPGVMLGYHRQPGETAAALDRDGYLLTGDLGIIDEEGYLHLVGRSKDVIIRAGFNVYPREVETRLEAHPAVREAAVIGLSDPLLGEATCACIVPEEGALVTDQEILEWCRASLADPKVPDRVRFLEAFPRTGTGKIRRVELSRVVKSSDAPPA